MIVNIRGMSMIEELKEKLNNLCWELSLDNEIVIKASQDLDRYIVEEQRKRLNEYNTKSL